MNAISQWGIFFCLKPMTLLMGQVTSQACLLWLMLRKCSSPQVSSCTHSLLYGKGFCFDQVFLQLLHVKLPSALLLDAHYAASFLAAVPGARAAWRQEGIKTRHELCVCGHNYRRSPPPPWQRGSWRLVRGQDAHVSVRTAAENLGSAAPTLVP